MNTRYGALASSRSSEGTCLAHQNLGNGDGQQLVSNPQRMNRTNGSCHQAPISVRKYR